MSAGDALGPSKFKGAFQAGPTTAIAALLIVGYVVAFFGVTLASVSERAGEQISRWDVLLLLQDPISLVATWFGKPGEAGFVDRLPILVLALAIVGYCTVLGWWLLSLLQLSPSLRNLEVIVFSAGTGLSLVSLYTLVVGLMGWLHWLVFALPIFGTLAIAGWHFRGHRAAATGRVLHDESHSELAPSARWLWLAAPGVALLVLGGMLPPSDFDVREYHLQAPKEYFQFGSIEFLSHNVYAQMPLGAEMFALASMVALDDWWSGALVGKTVISLFAPFTALGLFVAGRRLGSTSAGVVAAVLYIWAPWTARVSMSGLIEGAVGFYSLLAIYTFVLAGLDKRSPTERTSLNALSGFFAGSAVACKYPALLFVVFPLACALFCVALMRRRDRRTWFALSAFLLAAAVTCGPWFAKNLIQTGNPTYPLLYGVFGGRSRTDQLNQRWQAAHRPRPRFATSAGNAFAPHEFIGSSRQILIRSEWLGPAVLPLAFLGMVVGLRGRSWVKWLILYLTFALAAWWFATHRIDRFLVPLLPIVCLFAGLAVESCRTKWWRGFVIVLLIVSSIYGFTCASSGVMLGVDRRFFVALDVLRRDPLRVDPMHLYFNQHKVEIDTLLLVGDAQPFDLEMGSVLYNTTFDRSVFAAIAEDRNAHEAHDEFRRRGITHIYVHWGEIDRYRSASNYGFSKFVQPEVFEQLELAGVMTSGGPADKKGRYWLYTVNDAIAKSAVK